MDFCDIHINTYEHIFWGCVWQIQVLKTYLCKEKAFISWRKCACYNALATTAAVHSGRGHGPPADGYDPHS